MRKNFSVRHGYGFSALLATTALAGVVGCATVSGIRAIKPSPAPAARLMGQDPMGQKLWKKMLQDSTPFREFGGYKLKRHLRSSGVKAVQIESKSRIRDELFLKSEETVSESNSRHGEAAAAILDFTANRLADKTIPVKLLERPENWQQGTFDLDDPQTRALFGNADIISLSEIYAIKGDQTDNVSGGSIYTRRDIDKADAFWRESHAILVWAAGNEGDEPEIALERGSANHAVRADTMLRVGESARDANTGEEYIVNWSSRSGPSVVTSNPFKEGFRYQYYRQGEGMRQYAASVYKKAQDDKFDSDKDVFASTFRAAACEAYLNTSGLTGEKGCKEQMSMMSDQVRKCHPDFDRAVFPGKDVLLADPFWKMGFPDEVKKSYVECLVSAADYKAAKEGADSQGFVTGIAGTSFSTPHMAGMIAAARARHAQLTEQDLVAATLMTARPIKQVATGTGGYQDVFYHDNGRGLLHNDYEGGFGYVGEDDYITTTDIMATVLEENPDLATKEKRVSSPLYEYQNIGDDAHPHRAAAKRIRAYPLDVAEDAIVMRANLMIRFDEQEKGVPLKIRLVSPSGGEIEVSPSNPAARAPFYNGQAVYSLVTTDGHFGNHAKGRWVIRPPAGVRILEAKMDIIGVEPRGLIDLYLDSLDKSVPHAPRPMSAHKSPPVPAPGVS